MCPVATLEAQAHNVSEVPLRFLKLHTVLTLADFVVREGFKLTGKSQESSNSDEPFGWVILVPTNSVPEALWEFMMAIRMAEVQTE